MADADQMGRHETPEVEMADAPMYDYYGDATMATPYYVGMANEPSYIRQDIDPNTTTESTYGNIHAATAHYHDSNTGPAHNYGPVNYDNHPAIAPASTHEDPDEMSFVEAHGIEFKPGTNQIIRQHGKRVRQVGFADDDSDRYFRKDLSPFRFENDTNTAPRHLSPKTPTASSLRKNFASPLYDPDAPLMDELGQFTPKGRFFMSNEIRKKLKAGEDLTSEEAASIRGLQEYDTTTIYRTTYPHQTTNPGNIGATNPITYDRYAWEQPGFVAGQRIPRDALIMKNGDQSNPWAPVTEASERKVTTNLTAATFGMEIDPPVVARKGLGHSYVRENVMTGPSSFSEQKRVTNKNHSDSRQDAPTSIDSQTMSTSATNPMASSFTTNQSTSYSTANQATSDSASNQAAENSSHNADIADNVTAGPSSAMKRKRDDDDDGSEDREAGQASINNPDWVSSGDDQTEANTVAESHGQAIAPPPTHPLLNKIIIARNGIVAAARGAARVANGIGRTAVRIARPVVRVCGQVISKLKRRRRNRPTQPTEPVDEYGDDGYTDALPVPPEEKKFRKAFKDQFAAMKEEYDQDPTNPSLRPWFAPRKSWHLEDEHKVPLRFTNGKGRFHPEGRLKAALKAHAKALNAEIEPATDGPSKPQGTSPEPTTTEVAVEVNPERLQDFEEAMARRAQEQANRQIDLDDWWKEEEEMDKEREKEKKKKEVEQAAQPPKSPEAAKEAVLPQGTPHHTQHEAEESVWTPDQQLRQDLEDYLAQKWYEEPPKSPAGERPEPISPPQPGPEVAAPLVVSLSDEQRASVEKALAGGNPDASVGPKDVTRKDIGTILPRASFDRESGWLNDVAIETFLGYVVEEATARHATAATIDAPPTAAAESSSRPSSRASARAFAAAQRDAPPAFHVFNPALMKNVKEKGVQSVARWARRAKIPGEKLLGATTLFFPINLSGAHWSLLMVHPQRREIHSLDSLAGAGGDNVAVRLVLDWLRQELKDTFRAADWTVLATPSTRQGNMRDCGVFTCVNALAHVRGLRPEAVRAEEMEAAREMMVAALVGGGLGGLGGPGGL
ncbi:MAG: hypothetical protein M1822_008166 [Bathelium mastoideum]|nr:MAG: hypothetical protein M1822_008166 [Bathelium mastoideum]